MKSGPGLEKYESWEFPFFSPGMWSIGRENRPWKWRHDGTIWQFPCVLHTRTHLSKSTGRHISTG